MHNYYYVAIKLKDALVIALGWDCITNKQFLIQLISFIPAKQIISEGKYRRHWTIIYNILAVTALVAAKSLNYFYFIKSLDNMQKETCCILLSTNTYLRDLTFLNMLLRQQKTKGDTTFNIYIYFQNYSKRQKDKFQTGSQILLYEHNFFP